MQIGKRERDERTEHCKGESNALGPFQGIVVALRTLYTESNIRA
jgi:hypothetical protein